MRRTILLALVAALTLALGFNAVASAGSGVGAHAAAKKKAAKKKCAKPKAKKKKAGKSLAEASAKKKKAAKCAKPKAKKKATPKPGPKGPSGPTTFGDGTYRDAANSVTITVTNGGQEAQIGFVSGPCFGNLLVNVEGPIAQQGSVVKGSGTQSMLGGRGSIKWTLSVTPSNLSYQFDTDSNFSMPDEDPCMSNSSDKGTLVKQ